MKENPIICDTRARSVVVNAHRMLRHKYRGSPLWALVSDLTSYGSTVSTILCLRVGLDPHQDCKTKQLKPSEFSEQNEVR